MGMDEEQSQADSILMNQIQQNQSLLESKRKNLAEQRLSIVKNNNRENWDNPIKPAA